jgi:endo-1,4-beta-xylanase
MMGGVAAGGATVGLMPLVRASALSSLKEAARSRGLLFGSESDVPIAAQSPAYGALFLQQCELFAAQVTWKYISPRAGVENLDRDPNIAWAIEHGLRLTGGHLLWPKRIPEWESASSSDRDYQAAALSHIQTICKKFTGKVFSWNVVNEAIDTRDGRSDGLLNTGFVTRMGPEFIDRAFQTAREAAPGVMLAYNDGGLELESSYQSARQAALLRLIEQWKKRNVPIDAIGLQTHIHLADMEKFNGRAYREFLRTIASFGLRIIITEFDVLDVGAPTQTNKRDQAISDVYRKVLSVALDEPAVCALVTWGLCDRYSWYNARKNSGYIRFDGTDERPLPFDADFQPKPQFKALIDLLEHAPIRKLPPNA